jgi:hypothetical protein
MFAAVAAWFRPAAEDKLKGGACTAFMQSLCAPKTFLQKKRLNSSKFPASKMPAT